MDIKDQLIKMPLISPLGHDLISSWRAKSDKRVIKRLTELPHPVANQIGRILTDLKKKTPNSQTKWVDRIEAERKRLLSIQAPLVDETFNNEGIYDGKKSIQEVCLASRDSYSALFLHLLIRSLKPGRIIELGTNLGISSAYIGIALQDYNRGEKMLTLDVSPHRQKIAKEVHQNLGLNNIEYVRGLFQDTLADTLEKMEHIDLAFIDGHHQYKPTLQYFEKIYPFSRAGTVFIFDDIRYSTGMKRAWEELKTDHRFDFVADFKNMGICVRAGESSTRRFVIPTIHRAFVVTE